MVDMKLLLIDRVNENVVIHKVPDRLANKDITHEEIVRQMGWDPEKCFYLITTKPFVVNITMNPVVQSISIQ